MPSRQRDRGDLATSTAALTSPVHESDESNLPILDSGSLTPCAHKALESVQ